MFPADAAKRVVVISDSIAAAAEGPLVEVFEGRGWSIEFDAAVNRTVYSAATVVEQSPPSRLHVTKDDPPCPGTDIVVTLPVDRTGSEPVAIANTGYGVLDWTFDDPDAGPSDERIELLREGAKRLPAGVPIPGQVDPIVTSIPCVTIRLIPQVARIESSGRS